MKRKSRRPWRVAGVFCALAALLLALKLLLLSGSPLVPPAERVKPDTVRTARSALERLRRPAEREAGPARVSFSRLEVESLAALAGRTARIERVSAGMSEDALVLAASLRLPLGQWLNLTVAIPESRDGFPSLQSKVGRLHLPQWASGLAAKWAYQWLKPDAASLPPLHSLVQSFAVTPERVGAELNLPRTGGLIPHLAGFGAHPVDAAVVAKVFCRLTGLQRSRPSSSLAAHIRRAFDGYGGDDPVAYNRAALVALARFTVGEQVEEIMPAAAAAPRACRVPSEPLLLAGRPDLAKHWTFAAALRSVFAGEIANSMAEWKELSDSLPDGSGFSFPDLAADRSGVRAAEILTNPGSAARAAIRFRGMTEEGVFPIALLAQLEGLSEREFLSRYGSLHSEEYESSVTRIDGHLRNLVAM